MKRLKPSQARKWTMKVSIEKSISTEQSLTLNTLKAEEPAAQASLKPSGNETGDNEKKEHEETPGTADKNSIHLLK